MTKTIKEITEAFYDVTDKYTENETFWEVWPITLKEEFKPQIKSDLENVVKSFSNNLDNFATAFAAFMTCVINYDIAEGSVKELSEEEDTNGRLYIKSIEESIENIIDDKQPNSDKLRAFLKKFCTVVCENNYIDSMTELYKDYGSEYSVVKLYSFCYVVFRYCTAGNEKDKDFWFEYVGDIFDSMGKDFIDYVFADGDYRIDYKKFNPAFPYQLLPFCLVKSNTEMIADSISDVYQVVCEKMGISVNRELDLQSFCLGFKKLIDKSDREGLFFVNDLFSKIAYLSKCSKTDREGDMESYDWYDCSINRNDAPAERCACLHIPTSFPHEKNYREFFDTKMKYERKKQELEEVNQELEKANNDKNQIISDFCHRYKNLRANSLYRLAHVLLEMDDANLKMYGRLALLEYGIKEELVKEVEMLRLKFHNTRESRDELVTKVSESIDYSEDDTVSALDILRKAITRSVITIVHDGDSEAKMIRRFCFSDCDLISLRNSFESKMLFHENGDAVSWLNKNIIKLSVTLSDEWKKIRFKSGQYMDIVLTDLISEVIMNAFKYADKTQPMTIEFSEKEDALIVKSSNMTISSKKGIPSSKQGIKSNKNILDILNEACKLNEESIETEESADGVFSVTAVIGKALLPKEV